MVDKTNYQLYPVLAKLANDVKKEVCMCQMNVLQAKTELSKILSLLENREEEEVIIARNGHPVAKITLLEQKTAVSRIGAAKGRFTCPAEDVKIDNEVAQLFGIYL